MSRNPSSPPYELTPEFELMLACSRQATDTAVAARVRSLIDGDLDWNRFMQMTLAAQLEPLVHARFERVCPDVMKRPEVARLGVLLGRRMSGSARLLDELPSLAADIERSGIPIIFYKGPVLVAQAYGDIGLRYYSDLDVLLPPEHVPRFKQVLAERGLLSDDLPGDIEKRIAGGYLWALTFVNADASVIVDAHWALLPGIWSIPIDYDGLWARSTRTTIDGTPLTTFSLEDALFVIILHATKEKWWRLRMVCDVAHFIGRHPDLDWDLALEMATAQGGRRIFLLGIHLAARLLDAPVPDRITDASGRDRLVARLCEDLIRYYDHADFTHYRIFRLSSFRYLVLDRSRDRLAYVLRTIFAPRLIHIRIVRLPAALYPLYYPIKVVHDFALLPLWLCAGAAGRAVNGLYRRIFPAPGQKHQQ